MPTRRIFLRDSAIIMAGVGATPLWLGKAAGAPQRKRKTLVVVFQRGAADGLNIVVPFGEKRYYELRPSIGIPAPASCATSGGAAALDLDGHFGLHPALQPMKSLWDSGMLAIVEATGSPDPTRSHFDGQGYMESGTPGTKRDGWLNRALSPAGGVSPLRAVAISANLPRTLQGERPASAVGDMWQFSAGEDMASSRDAVSARRLLDSLDRVCNPFDPLYIQGGQLGLSLRRIAQLIQADAGVEAAFAEAGNWDHHQNEPNQMATGLRRLASALTAFCLDMGDRMEDIVIVTLSEFGRTARQNGDNGTDHGHGSMMFVLGGPVRGGRIFGKWPGLEKEQLYEGRDLAVTTDFRTVLSELVAGHLGNRDVARVFPGYRPARPLGLLKG